MTATNHAISGALIGLGLADLQYAVPIALLYHFALDAVPHYDPLGNESDRLRSSRFKRQLQIDAALCAVIVLLLALLRPQHWLIGVICAFVCVLPDLFWLPKFTSARRTGQALPNTNWLWRFHAWVQWKTGPDLWWVEAMWLLVFGSLFAISI